MATDEIRDRCAETLTVGDIALSAGVHPVHLARTFRRFIGCSPGDYLRLCRVVRGVELLVGTRRSLSEVALASGFVDARGRT
jgi:AraC family transcriptional regulator